MIKKKAKLFFKHNYFDIIEQGNFVMVFLFLLSRTKHGHRPLQSQNNCA